MLRPCLGPGRNGRCLYGHLIERGLRDPDCQRAWDRTRRPTTAQRGYGYRWQRFSRQQRVTSPVCVDCGSTRDLTPNSSLQALRQRFA